MAFTIDYSQRGASEQEIRQSAASAAGARERLKKISFFEGEIPDLPAADGVLVVGIGGSSLGARAIISATSSARPVFYLEDINPVALKSAQQHLTEAYGQDKRYLLVVVSKSGTTLETLTNLSVILPVFRSLEPEYKSRTIVVTDESTPLAQFAQQQGLLLVFSPANISSRFAIFTSIGMIPIAAAGIDVAGVYQGAKKMLETCLGDDSGTNPALWGATVTWFNRDYPLQIFFALNRELEDMARWNQQLIAESLGKKNLGFTPIVNNATDLHSMLQRYFDGPQDCYMTFFTSSTSHEGKIPADSAVLPLLAGKSLDEITAAISSSAIAAAASAGLPHAHTAFDALEPETLGAFCMLKMAETIFLADVMGVDPFDQPAIESYKQEIRKKLNL